MPSLSHRVLFLVGTFALSFPLVASPQVLAKDGSPGTGGMVNYLKPQKNGYLNQSQDRVIKKKAFNVKSMPMGVGAINPELGFFAILPADKLSDADYAEGLLSNDKVNGLSCEFAWSTLEPSE